MRGRRVVGSSQSFLCPPSITCFTGHYVHILSVPRIRICSSFGGLAAFTKECPPQTTRRLFGSWSKDRPPAPDRVKMRKRRVGNDPLCRKHGFLFLLTICRAPNVEERVKDDILLMNWMDDVYSKGGLAPLNGFWIAYANLGSKWGGEILDLWHL